MISSDDHPPPDPQKSRDFKIDNDEKAHASVSDSDLDLFKSLIADLDDTNNPLPRFSVRDYVFNSRSNDIACNWPFSHKTLQICLQHGVKNLLPPFQSLESLRDNSSVEIRCSDEENVTNFNGKPILDQSVLVTSYGAKSNLELTLESANTNSSRSKGDKESQTHLQEDPTCTRLKKTFLVSSGKTQIDTIQTAIRKCRLGAAKLNTVVEPVEEVTPKSFIFLETMASKVCPVCKTFSSSSNTTLNAHIDRCLSGESSMKWTANPKVIVKHRIKPRKTRLLIDIYKTAPHCTVEELDARNGTSWANKSTFPVQELEFQGEEEKEERRATTVVPEVADHEGAVYIDTDGTKVRILSMPKDDYGARKLQKKEKPNNFFMEKKKGKNHEQKHQEKYLKPSQDSKKLCSSKPDRRASSEVTTGREENTGTEPMNPEAHTKLDDLPILRPTWACSKRTGLAKRLRSNILLTHKKNLSLASDESFSESVSRTPPSSSNKKGSLSTYKEKPNRASEFSAVDHYEKKRSSLLTKPSSKYLKKEGMLLHKSCEDPSDVCPSKRFKGSDVRSKGSKFLSPGKKVLSVSKGPASKLNLKRKFSALKRSCVHPFSEQTVVDFPYQDNQKHQSRAEEDMSGKPSSESMNMDYLEVKRKDATKTRRQENSVASRSSNGDSSAWLKTDVADRSCDVEYVRKEARSHKEQFSSVQVATGIDVAASSLGLSNSLNPDNMFDTKERDDDKEMYCVDFIEKTMHIGDVTEDLERQQNSFHEVDPVPLTEPPGSVLPSPGRDTVSEELHGHSSLAKLSEDQNHHDTMDRDSMSDSPISTISNPRLARSDSDKFLVRSTSLNEDTKGFSGMMVDAVNEKYAPIASTNSDEWRSANTLFTDKGHTPGFKNNQSCCCSRKEGVSFQTVAFSHQESTLLRNHPVEFLNFRPKMFSISNYPAAPALAIASPPAIKLPAYSECDSIGSPSKSVLRLMGKNLTVVEDVSLPLQFKPPPHSPAAHFPNVQNEHPAIFSHNQNGFNSKHPDNMRPSHASDTTFRSTTYMDGYGYGNPMIPQSSQNLNRFDGQMVSEMNMHKAPSEHIKEVIIIDDSPEGNDDMCARRNEESFSSILGHNHSSLPFINGSFQTCLPFREVADNGNLAKWNYAPAGSSRSLTPSIYYPRSSS